jgi:hypothetical protein
MALFTSAIVYICTTWIRRHIKLRRANPAGLPYPPGPKGLPLLGSLLELHESQEHWLTYDNWARVYGTLYNIIS